MTLIGCQHARRRRSREPEPGRARGAGAGADGVVSRSCLPDRPLPASDVDDDMRQPARHPSGTPCGLRPTRLCSGRTNKGSGASAGTARPLRRRHHDNRHPRSRPRTCRGPQPRRPDVPVMSSEAGKHIRLAAEAQVISSSASRCITARERRRALQVRGNAGAGGARPGSFVVLYRTMQSDIAVQDTERSTP